MVRLYDHSGLVVTEEWIRTPTAAELHPAGARVRRRHLSVVPSDPP